MSGNLFDRRLHGVAVYNPDLLSRDELVEQFVARTELLEHLMAGLRRADFSQHQVLIGSRGMGKTTLLRRLRYAIEDDDELRRTWIPVTFPEEQYNVGRLSDLYLNFIDGLSDALEQRGRRDEAAALDDARDALPQKDEARRAEAALALLLAEANRLDRRLLLLIDNLDLVLERLEKQPTAQWALREVLSREHRILLIGAMPVIIGATYEHDAPFYDFFRIHELHGLTREETREVLLRLAQHQEAPEVEQLLKTDPARIDTLHTLTAGNPRTIVLLFGVLAQGTEGDVRSDLEKLLDQCTPLYKSRFEALPAQAQQVVDAVAIHWDPISAGELAEKLPFEVNSVSAQLNRLVQQGVLEKVEYYPPTKIGFQVAERFFNIWYLMRASRRVRRRLIWLVQFLRLFYGAEELNTKAHELLGRAVRDSRSEKLRHAEFCLAMAQLIEDDWPTRSALESRAIRTLVADAYLSAQLNVMLDLDGADSSLRDVVDRERWVDDFDRAITAWPVEDELKVRAKELIGGANIPRQTRLSLARQSAERSVAERTALFEKLENERRANVEYWGASFDAKIRRALQLGFMDTATDENGAKAAAAALGQPELEVIFILRRKHHDLMRQLVTMTDEPFVKLLTASLLHDLGDVDEARLLIAYVREQASFAFADYIYGLVCAGDGKLEESATALESALSARYAHFLPQDFAWFELAKIRFRLGRTEAAFEAFERALGDQREESVLVSYGRALETAGRYEDAESIVREALGKAPRNLDAARILMKLLTETSRSNEALVFAREFADLDDLSFRWGEARALLELDRYDEVKTVMQSIAARDDLDLTRSFKCAHVLFMLDDGDGAMRLIERALERSRELVLDSETGFFDVLAEVVRQGHGSAVRELIERLELIDAFRPIHEALLVVESGETEQLKRVAPEIRMAARQLLQLWGRLDVKKKRVAKRRK